MWGLFWERPEKNPVLVWEDSVCKWSNKWGFKKKKIDKKKILQRGMVNTYKRVGAIEYWGRRHKLSLGVLGLSGRKQNQHETYILFYIVEAVKPKICRASWQPRNSGKSCSLKCKNLETQAEFLCCSMEAEFLLWEPS